MVEQHMAISDRDDVVMKHAAIDTCGACWANTV